MPVSRIVLDPEVRLIVDRIQEKTRTTSPSAAISLIVSRYARHLLETWELTTAHHPESDPRQYSLSAPLPSAALPIVDSDFVFTSGIDF